MENCLPGDRALWVERIHDDLERHKCFQEREAEQSEAASPNTFTRGPIPTTSPAEKVNSAPNF